jgi:putative addiction module killer protein
MAAIPRDIQRYVTSDGRIPFEDWLLSLRSLKTQAKIDARLQRVTLGNLGDMRFVGEGVYELKIDYGPGIGFILLRSIRSSFLYSVEGIRVLRIRLLRLPRSIGKSIRRGHDCQKCRLPFVTD